MTNVDMGDGSKDDLEEEEQEGEDDQWSTTAVVRHPMQTRWNKPKRGKEAGKCPLVKQSHLAKYIVPSMVRKLSAQQQHHARQEHASPMLNGFIGIQLSKASPLLAQPPVIANGVSGHITASNMNGNANGNTNAQLWKIMVAVTRVDRLATKLRTITLREVLTKRHNILKARLDVGTRNEETKSQLDELWICKANAVIV